MNQQLLLAILGSVARIGLDATMILIERMNKPNATVDDAIAACKAAREKGLQDYINDPANK